MVGDGEARPDGEPAQAADDDGTVEIFFEEDDPASGPSELEKVQKELAEVREQWVRTLADLDNYRKRTERESRETKRYALVEPMRDLVGVVDNLERALAAGGSVDDLKLGVRMTLQQLVDVLKSHGVRDISAAGTPFDPSMHDAVARFEDASVSAPTVAEELQRGYVLHDRLLRPALVKVAMPVSLAGGAPAAVQQEETPGDGA